MSQSRKLPALKGHNLKILSSGVIPRDPSEFETLRPLLESISEVIVPNNLEEGVSHWWKLKYRGREVLYIGTRDSLRLWMQIKKRRRNRL